MMNLIWVVLAYLAGSVSAAILVCRALRLPDPREQGSGNPGTTNVLRIGGRGAALATLAGDLLKGLLPVLVVRALDGEPALIAAVGFAAFLGHLYPVFFRFQGGKGVATALGALLGFSLWVGLATIGVWLAMAALFRRSSLAALAASLSAPLWLAWWMDAPALTYAAAAMTALLYWRHRGNIRRLLDGTEPRIGDRKSE